MRIRRADIAGFGRLRDLNIDFGPGVTLILGPNETGKTTLLYALAQTLFGKPSQRSAFPELTPWAGGAFAATLDLEHDGARFRVRRRFDDKAAARAAALYQLHEDDSETLITQEQPAIRAWLAAALGTADDRIFYRTCCLTPADLTPLDNYAGLREQLERAASGAEVAVAAALQRLDARQATLRRGVSQPALQQNWGALKRADEARKDWEARLHEANRQQRRLHEVRDAVAAVQQQLTEGTGRLAEITAVLEQDRARRDLLTRQADVKANWATLETERERYERLTTEQQRLHALRDALPAAFADPAAVRAQLHAVPPLTGSTRNLALALLIGGILLAILLAVLAPKIGLYLAPVLALAGGAAGLPMLLRESAQTRLRQQCCRDLGVLTLDDATQRLAVAEKYQRELDAMRLALEAVAEPTASTERRRAVALEIATLDEKLAQLHGDSLSAEAVQRLQREYDALHSAMPGRQQKEKELLRELAVLEDAERDSIDLEDGVAYWQREEARARQEDAALALAHTWLVAAGEQAHRQLADPLALRIAPLFAAMTGGRYPQVRVEGDARAFHVYPLDANGTPVNPDQLSRGARDQFLLAVRLAFGQAIAGDTTPIFLLDDPFLHFDAARRTESLTLLTELGKTSQIILATHDATLANEMPDATVISLSSHS